MKLITNLLKTLKPARSSQGFTLIELMVASALTTVVVGAAGWGMLAVLNTNVRANAESTMLYDTNRTLEFISDEVKMAKRIAPDAVAAVASIPDLTLPTGAKPVLVLEIAENRNIVYYTKPATNPWIGPEIIVRWGPDLTENGQYDTTQLSDPSTWRSAEIIDMVDNAQVTLQCPRNYLATNPDAVRGFHACVQGDDLVQLNLNTVASSTISSPQLMSVSTNAFARGESSYTPDVALIPPTDTPSDPTDPTNTPTDPTDHSNTPIYTPSEPVTPVVTAPNFTLSCSGTTCTTLEIPEPASIKFELLGTQITCGAGGDSIPATAKVNFVYPDGKVGTVTLPATGPLMIASQPTGTRVNLDATAQGGSCNHFQRVRTDKVSETYLVAALRNGDSVPNITPFGNQATISSIVSSYIENGKIKLAPNQVIYLFELGTPSTTSAAFDMQDAVVLATIENPTISGVQVEASAPVACSRRCQ